MMKLQRKNSTPKQKIVLELSMEELKHLRDLMSVLMPPDCKSTFSEDLSKINGNEGIESELWSRIHNLCCVNNLETDGDAPDFVITIPQHPELVINKIPPEKVQRKNRDSSQDECFELYDVLMNKK